MSNDIQFQKIKSFFDQIDGLDLHEKKGGTFYFPMYFNNGLMETPLEELELNVRSYNGLKRANFHTIGQLVEAIHNGYKLTQVRNLGTKSRAEIMEHLFFYQVNHISPENKMSYINEVIAMNLKKKEFH